MRNTVLCQLTLLLAIFTVSSTMKIVKIEAMYDAEKGVIYYNNMLFTEAKSTPNKSLQFLAEIDNGTTSTPNAREESKADSSSEISSSSPTKTKKTIEEEEELASGGSFWFYVGISIAITIFAGLMSGLTVGYLSIDDLVLELKTSTGTQEEKDQAEKVLPILHHNHWLLVTLLLMNAAAMETLPLILNLLMSELMAVIVSVTLVLLFGEIIPQAVCTGPSQIKIAAAIAPFTKFLMYISSPLSYPISLLLDYLLGTHTKSRFQNNDLKALIELHTHNALKTLHNTEEEHEKHLREEIGLDEDQANLMISAIEMNKKNAREKMIPIEKVFMYDYNKNITDINIITAKRFSRVPLYENDKNNVVGILRLKELIGRDLSGVECLKDLDIELRKPLVISPNMNLLDLLKEFRKGKSHMAFVTEEVEVVQKKLGLNRANSIIPKHELKFNQDKETMNKKTKILGIITLEDVIEEMINIEIKDEDDYDKEKEKKKWLQSSKRISQKFTKSFLQENEDFKKWIVDTKEKMSYKANPMSMLLTDEIRTPLLNS